MSKKVPNSMSAFPSPELDAGPLLLEAEDRVRVPIAPAAPQRLLHLLLGERRDHHGHMIFAAEIGGESDVLPQEPEREVRRLERAREHDVRNHLLQHAALPERALLERVEQGFRRDTGLDAERE